MELLQLRYFLVAARYEHMTKAAEVLQIAQPALSQSIKRLESELGVSLFVREKRSIRLNESGKFLEQRLIPILAALDDLPMALTEKSIHSRYTIHLNILAASRLVTDCVIAYKELHPNVHFRLWQNHETKQKGLCIRTAFSNEQQKENSRRILKETFYLAVPSSSVYASRASVRISEMKEENFISLPANRPIRKICDRFCLDSGFAPHITCESDNPESVRNLIAAGLGVGFWPEYSWGPLSTPEVTLLPIENPVCERDIIMTYEPGGENTEILRDFCEFLEEFAKNTPAYL